MSHDKDAFKIAIIKRRLVFVRGIYTFFLSILALKLFKLQILDGFFYYRRSRNNALRREFLIPKRGEIFDRNGTKIASTIVGKKLVYFAGRNNNLIIIRKVLNLLHRGNANTTKVLNDIKKQIDSKRNQKLVLARNLTKSEITRLKFNMVYYPNIDIEDYFFRKFPFGKRTSSLVGFVAGVRNRGDEVAKQNVDYRIGIAGIENVLNDKLGGRVGIRYNIIDATGKKVDETIPSSPINGSDIMLTIDQRLQTALSEAMEDKNGACTLLDVRTGDVLAMHSSPNINPNLTSIGVSNEEWEAEIKQFEYENGLFLNKNIFSTYAPGSTFKIISALTALQSGFDFEKNFRCTGVYQIGNRIFHCHKKEGHGLVNMNTALAKSCNCYFYHISTQIKCNDLYKMAKIFGLGVKHMPDFTNEASGLVPNTYWKKKVYNQIWFPGDTANMVLGQGYTNVTPLQLAIMVARLATNNVVEPRYLIDEKRKFHSLGIDEKYMDVVRKGLFSTINEPEGIAYGLARKKYQICGKTGTAQIVSERLENQDMRSGKIEKKKHSHALFVGYAPYDNPKFAVSVVIEHGIGGVRSAAPIGIKMLTNAIELEDNKF